MEQNTGTKIKRHSSESALNNLVSDFQGTWVVTCFGVAKAMNKIGDSKIITRCTGYNVMRDKDWGYFSITQEGDELVLNYNDKRNPWLLRWVRDRIKKDSKGWTGVFYKFGIKRFEFRLDR